MGGILVLLITICLFVSAKLVISPELTKKNMFYNMFLDTFVTI